MYLYAFYRSQKKQQLFHYTKLLISFFIADTERVYCAVRKEPLHIIQVNLSFQMFIHLPGDPLLANASGSCKR